MHSEPVTPGTPASLAERVRQAVETIRQLARSHGGDIELVRIDERRFVHVRLRGACSGCPSSLATLQLGLEQELRVMAPEIGGVIADGA